MKGKNPLKIDISKDMAVDFLVAGYFFAQSTSSADGPPYWVPI